MRVCIMKKTALYLLLLALITISHNVFAGEMEDAAKYFENKNYAKAIGIYTKLANAGNHTAQVLLGEMYWYGDGVEANEKIAENWFLQASSLGNEKANAYLKLMAERKKRRAEILYYTTSFDGKDVKENCTKPTDFSVYINKTDIEKIADSYQQWVICYNQFVERLNQALPPGKNIPVDLSQLMNEVEMAQATTLMDKVYSSISAHMQATSTQLQDQFEQWKKATEEAIDARNKKIALENRLRSEKSREFNYEQKNKMLTEGDNKNNNKNK